MAITKTLSGFSNEEVKAMGQDLAEMWDWDSVTIEEIDGYAYCTLQVGNSRIEIYRNRYYTIAEIYVPQSDNYVFSKYAEGLNLLIRATRTESALLLQFGSGSIEPYINATTIIISYATNHHTGIKEPVLSIFENPAIDTTGDDTLKTFIASQDVIQGKTSQKSIGYVNSNSAISALTPFFYRDSRCTLDGVFLFTAYQPPYLYRGDCTINGRRYYVCNLIAALDE